MTDGDQSPRVRDTLRVMARPLYVPSLFLNTGAGMLLPVLPLYLLDIDLSYSVVATIVAAAGVGTLLGQFPSSRAVERLGTRRTGLLAAGLCSLTGAALGLTAVSLVLLGLRAVSGVGSAAWVLSRHDYMSSDVPAEVRGRVIATFGGVNRLATLLGPIIGGLVAQQAGFETAFTVSGLVSLLGAIPLLGLQSGAPKPGSDQQTEGLLTRLSRVVGDHRTALAKVGALQSAVMTVREGRRIVLPLLGASMGMDVAAVGLLVSISAAADLVLFPVAGFLMDRFGRAAAIAPSIGLMGAGLGLAGFATTEPGLIAAATVMGVGNGLGAGSMLTIGADLAPERDSSYFLSVIGFVRDSGRIVGPLIVGYLADSLGLEVSAFALAAVAFLAVYLVLAVVGDTRPS